MARGDPNESGTLAIRRRVSREPLRALERIRLPPSGVIGFRPGCLILESQVEPIELIDVRYDSPGTRRDRGPVHANRRRESGNALFERRRVVRGPHGAAGTTARGSLRRNLRAKRGEHLPNVANGELRQRRLGHVPVLRRNAKRAIDEHVAVLSHEHRRTTQKRRVVFLEQPRNELTRDGGFIGSTADDLTGVQVVCIARMQRQVRHTLVRRTSGSVDERLVTTDYVSYVPVDDPCRSLVRGDTEHARISRDYGSQVGQTLTSHDVHVGGGVAQIAKALLVPRVVLDVVVVAGRAAHQEVAQDGHPG